MLTGLFIFVVDWILIGFLISLFDVYTYYLRSKYFECESFTDIVLMILVTPYVFMMLLISVIMEWLNFYNYNRRM